MRVDFASFKKKYNRPDNNSFPVGSTVYKGHQGNGKSLSMCHDAFELQNRFPNCHVYSNMIIRGLNNFHLIQKDEDLEEALAVSHGADGTLLILDEAHLYFHKSSGIPMDVLTCISEQRKDRRSMFFSTQIWEEMDISLRKQVKYIVDCRTLFRKFQINTYYRGYTLHYDKLQSAYVADKVETRIYKHNQELYDSYDTLQKIVRNSEYSRPLYNPVNVNLPVMVGAVSKISKNKGR